MLLQGAERGYKKFQESKNGKTHSESGFCIVVEDALLSFANGLQIFLCGSIIVLRQTGDAVYYPSCPGSATSKYLE